MLEKFFLIGEPPLITETGTYIPLLVLASYIVACLASYTALDLAEHTHKKNQKLWHYAGSFAMGAGIWGMHFVGMLAYKMDMAIHYNPELTILSMIPAIIVSYFVLGIVKAGYIGFSRIISSAVLLGSGICLMHYSGMAAMEMDGDILYKPTIFALSILVAVVASGAALVIAFVLTQYLTRYKLFFKIVSASVMGAAICGMHYTGMAATVFVPWANCRYDSGQSFEVLALVITLVILTILFMAIFLRVILNSEQNDKKERAFMSPIIIVFLFYFIICCIFTGAIYFLGDRDIGILQEKYQDQYRNKASLVSKKIENTFSILYQSARTISRLPSVRSIDRHGKNLSPNDLITIQEIYNNIAANISISEVYITSHDFTPGRIDPVTGKPEEPILMFDSSIVGRIGGIPSITDKDSTSESDSDVEEIEIYEYNLLHEQLSWFKQHHQTYNVLSGLDLPAITGKEVITCDNTRYSLDDPDDKDRSGFVYSVPFYTAEGSLKGTISIVMLSDVLRNLFIEPHYALQNIEYNYQILPYDNQSQPYLSKEWVDKGEKDTRLLFSDVIPLSIKDANASWSLWIGIPHNILMNSAEYASIRQYQYIAYIIILLTFFASMTIFYREHCNSMLIRKSKNDLSKEKFYLAAIMDNLMQGVITINKKGEIKTFNRWAERMFDRQCEDVIGLNVNILMPEPYHSAHDGYLQNYIKSGDAKIIGTSREVEGIRKNGESFPLHLSVTEINVNDESIFVGLIMDITEQKEKEERIKDSKMEAERANQSKTDFLANMSHELRTPLNSILGITRMLVDDNDTKKDRKEMAETVLKSATNLLQTVNDILDISKVESGNLILEKISFRLKDTTSNLLEIMAPLANEKGLSFNLYYKDKKNIPWIIGDSFRLNRILTNLVGNAIKYTNEGNITVMFDSHLLDDNKIEIYCSVKDTGVGVSEDKLEDIFQKFTQADVSTTREFGGTGLGLSITKELVEIMGGEIGVESVMGEGSNFWFKIPFIITDEIDEETKYKTQKERRRRNRNDDEVLVPVKDAHVLVAEDHLLNQDFIARLLSRMGFKHFDIVENGILAVEAFENKKYDLILMDCHMPEKNGYEATAEIRNNKKITGLNIPIIALTADAMVGTREKCLKAGMSEYLDKPIDPEKLKHIFETWISFDKEKADESERNKERKMNGSVDISLLKEYADTPEDLERFIKIFTTQSDESIETMEEHCVDGECREWVEAAHKFKGGSGMIGAKQLHKLCEQAQGMSESSAEERNKKLEEIKQEYKVVKDELDSSNF